jgi:protein CpxP
MSKVKLLAIITVCLLILNLFLIGFLVTQKPALAKREEPKKYIIETLNFDAVQIKKYQLLIDEHRSSIKHARHKMMRLKNELYTSLQDTSYLVHTADSLITEIGKTQTEIEHIHYAHFKAIKQLCKPEQQAAYSELTLELAKLFSPAHSAHEK